MEFLDPNHILNIRDEEWRIYSKNLGIPSTILDGDIQCDGFHDSGWLLCSR